MNAADVRPGAANGAPEADFASELGPRPVDLLRGALAAGQDSPDEWEAKALSR